MTTEIYTVGFGESATASIDVLGGKGFNLVRMSNLGVPVPHAIILPTSLCLPVINGTASVQAVTSEVYLYLDEIEKLAGYLPIFSVRSGAKVSCPGMCDTILNVGLTSGTVKVWEKRIGERAAWDSYRRLIQMFGDVVFGIASSQYEVALDVAKEAEGVATDTELSVDALKGLVAKFLELTPDFPQTFKMQLRKAISAVFKSWNTDRAITYRTMHNLPHDSGTAVIIQAMVFGNMNDQSATGVLFTRNPSTGEDKIVGEYLVNAQGEDVVAGVRTPLPLGDMQGWNAEVFDKLVDVSCMLEAENKDMQDIEFTVQNGELFILQTRNAKRTALAAVKVAVDLVASNFIDRKTAFSRLTYDQYLTANRPIVDPSFSVAPTGVGIAASTGFAVGVAVFSSEKAIELAKTQPVILLSKETTPDDIAGMNAAVGILTQTGGSSSHAAVVARGMDKVCVVGCLDLVMVPTIPEGYVWALNGYPIVEGFTTLTLEGNTGNIWVGVDVPLISPENTPEIATLDSWVKDVVPFIERVADNVSTGYRYLETTNFDADIEGFVKAVDGFKGIVSLATSKDNIASYDLPLFELVSSFNEDEIRGAKLNALMGMSPSNTVRIDLAGHTLTGPAKKKLTSTGYTFLREVGSIEELLFADGLVKCVPELAEKAIAVQKVFNLKKISGESIQNLVFAGDSVPTLGEFDVLVSSKAVVMTSLMSA